MYAPDYGVLWVKLDPDAEQPSAEIVVGVEQVSIEGRLFDVQGRPVRGVTVAVDRIDKPIPRGVNPRDARDYLTIRDPSSERQAATSDTDGRFTLRGFKTNVRVKLAVDDPRFAILVLPVEIGEASNVKRLNIALEPARIVTGRVTYGDTGKPAQRARINYLTPIQAVYYSNRFETDGDGRFRANLMSADHYRLEVLAPEGEPYLKFEKFFRWPKGALEYSIDVVLPRGAAIQGKIVAPNAGTRAQARVTRSRRAHGLRPTGPPNSGTSPPGRVPVIRRESSCDNDRRRR